MLIKVDTARYCRETGKFPAGRKLWCFMLRSDRVTEKDHYHNPGVRRTYPAALKRAIALAQLRRAHIVEVMP